MVINRTELSLTLRILGHAIDEKPSAMKGSDMVTFSPGMVCTFSDVIGVQVMMECVDINATIPFSPLVKLINSTKDNSVMITTTDKEIRVMVGKTMATFPVSPPIMATRYLRTIPDGDVWRNCPDGLADKIKLCTIAGLESSFSGVFIAGESVMAADSSLIAHALVAGNMERMWINNMIAGKLVKLGKLSQYAINGSWVHFKNGQVIMSGRKLFDSEYPDKKIFGVERIWKEQGSVVCSFPFPEPLIKTLTTSKQFADDGNNGEAPVEILLESDGITVTSSGISGMFSSKVEATIPIDEPTSINVDIAQMLNLIKKGASTIELITYKANQMIVFRGDDWQFMVGTA